jgi:hypothetical protein
LIRSAPALVAALLFAAPTTGCGGSVVSPVEGSDAGTHHEGGHGTPDRVASTDAPVPPDAPANDDFPVFREDACPDVSTSPPDLECDPLVQSTCAFGFACYPIPPRGSDNCHPGLYASACLPAGKGTQGAPCGDGTDCAAGFVCVKSGQGDECVKLCRIDQFSSCSDGRVCRELDVAGSGLGGCE